MSLRTLPRFRKVSVLFPLLTSSTTRLLHQSTNPVFLNQPRKKRNLCFHTSPDSWSSRSHFSDSCLVMNKTTHHHTHHQPASGTEFPWGQVQQLNYQDANTGSIVQACHAMIFARTEAKFVTELPCRAWVMMQMRFDGKLGFPGGIVSDLETPDATLEEGLNRELEEELGLNLARFAFNKSHYVVTHYCPRANLILNFYVQEVTETDYKLIEADALRSDEYGHECLGILRVPLYTLQDGHNGFPAFLQNQFAGTSILQVIVGLLTQEIISEEEVRAYHSVLPKHQAYRRLMEQAVTAYKERKAENNERLADA